MGYLALKVLHILSSTVLFGTGLGTAFQMWMAHLRGDPSVIASTARTVVLADWLFTATSGVAQPATGIGLILLAGYDPRAPWLIVSYGLYGLAGACWLVVVLLQIRVADIAARCTAENKRLPPQYYGMMRVWFWLGWPAFLSLIGIFWLMVVKPDLW